MASPAVASCFSTAIASCFSTAISSQLGPKLVSSSDAVLPLACHRPCRIPPLITLLREYPSAPIASRRQRRFARILAAVAQDEAAAEVEEETVSARAGEGVVVEEEEEGEEQEEQVQVAPNTKLYFGNLPYNCDSAELAGVVQEYASPELIEVLYDRETGRSRGFAFVTMSSVEDCEEVIKNLDGTQYGGRTMRVNFSDKPRPKEPLYPETEHKLFVGNLSWSVKSEDLTELFRQQGNVVGARVLYDGDTGLSRGYGFVCYSTKAEMENAVEVLDGRELDGRPIRISIAVGRKS